MNVRSTRTVLCSAAALLVLPILASAPARAGTAQPQVVEEQAAQDWAQLAPSQSVPRPRVDAVETHRGRTFIGGRFDTVMDTAGPHERHHFAVLDSATGQVMDLVVRINGPVLALVARRHSLYVGGSFTRVNGVSRANLVKLDARTGEVDPNFAAGTVDGAVKDLTVIDNRLFVGGSFDRALVALNRFSGRPTAYLTTSITGTLSTGAGPTSVNRFAVNPQHTRLVAVGNFTHVDDRLQRRAFMLKLGDRAARLSSWYYPPLMRRCRAHFNPKVATVSDVDFSPDGASFFLSATGGAERISVDGSILICDSVARFETSDLAPTRPTWVNYTGGDTVWTVEATGAAVYALGHFRWFDNAGGHDTKQPGAVDRRGIAALAPSDGAVLPWNPDMPSQRGGRALEATPHGLWAGSDTGSVNGQPRRGLAFFPLAPPPPPPAP